MSATNFNEAKFNEAKNYHETLDAAIEWSYTKLDERQRAMLNDGTELVEAYIEWFETGELPHRLTVEPKKTNYFMIAWKKAFDKIMAEKAAAPAATEKPAAPAATEEPAAPAGIDLGNGFYLAYSTEEYEPKNHEEKLDLVTDWAWDHLDKFWVRELDYSELEEIYDNWRETGEIPPEYAKKSHKRKSAYEIVQEEMAKYREELELDEAEAPPKKKPAPAAPEDDSDDDVIEIPPPKKPAPEVIVIDDDSDDEMEQEYGNKQVLL